MEISIAEEVVDIVRPDDIEQLEALLKAQLRGRVQGVRVLPSGEGVVLHGDSDSFYGKQLAQHVLMAASTLPIVANNIRVVWPSA
jgi:hypothetical protein